jgi:hypothetical protein
MTNTRQNVYFCAITSVLVIASYQPGVTKMIVNPPNKCAYCGTPIEAEQRWVREKVYQPALAGHDPTYRRYHAELFGEEELSCWEKRQMQVENARVTARAA